MDERGRVIEGLLKIKKHVEDRKKISDFLDGKVHGSYTINSDLTVDVNGTVHLYNMNLVKIHIKFGKFTGDFSCHTNRLTSLEGCPYWVGNSFRCWGNELKTLEHSSLHIGGIFDCDMNLLTTLEHAPKEPEYYGENPCTPIYARLLRDAHIQCRKVWI